MVFVTAVTLLLSSAILLFPDRTAVLLGASEHLLPLVKDYLLWFTPALVFQMWTAVGLFVIRLDGAPKLAMWCSVISALLNVLLDWLFIFPAGEGRHGGCVRYRDQCIRRRRYRFVVPAVPGPFVVPLVRLRAPQELAPLVAECGVSVSYRLLGLVGRSDSCDLDVYRKSGVYALFGR